MSFLNGIVEFISIISRFLGHLARDAVGFVLYVIEVIKLPPLLTYYMPVILGSCMTILAGAAVVKAIFGR